MAYNPYNVAAVIPKATIDSTAQRKEDAFAAKAQANKLENELKDMIEKQEAELKKGSKGRNPLVSLLAAFIPGGTAMLAMDTVARSHKQKDLIDKLKNQNLDKYKNTFLSDATRDLKKSYKDMEMSSGDALMSGLVDYAASKSMGKALEGFGLETGEGKFLDFKNFKPFENIKNVDFGKKVTEQGLKDNPWLTKPDMFGDVEFDMKSKPGWFKEIFGKSGKFTGFFDLFREGDFQRKSIFRKLLDSFKGEGSEKQWAKILDLLKK